MLNKIVLALCISAVAFAQQPLPVPGNSPFVDFRVGFPAPIAAGPGVASAVITVIPQLSAGYRLLDRLQIFAGFSYYRASATNAGATASFNTFFLAPSVAVDIVHSHDRLAIFYAKAGLPLGFDIMTQTGAPDSNGFVVGYDAALGARLSFTPAFALGVESGIFGIFINPERDTNFALTNFYASFMGTYYFSSK
jgi:hypothetical protein